MIKWVQCDEVLLVKWMVNLITYVINWVAKLICVGYMAMVALTQLYKWIGI